VLTPTEHAQTPPATLKFGNFQFYLTAYRNDQPLQGLQFSRPVTLVVRYSPALLLDLNPQTLQLQFWDGSAWSTAGVTPLSHDIANGVLTVALSHLSEFAFFAAPAPTDLDIRPEPDAALNHIYLPAVSH
jgi:hypothetical protein